MPTPAEQLRPVLERDIANRERDERTDRRLINLWRGELRRVHGGRPQPFRMWDSIEPALIPANAVAVAGYVGGHWPTFPDLLQRFPHAAHLSIAVSAREDAHCLDVEVGDAVPDEAPGWLRRQWERGVKRPWLYANASTWAAMAPILRESAVKRGQYRVWVADPTGVPHIVEGSDATQYDWHALGRNLDVSLCLPGALPL